MGEPCAHDGRAFRQPLRVHCNLDALYANVGRAPRGGGACHNSRPPAMYCPIAGEFPHSTHRALQAVMPPQVRRDGLFEIVHRFGVEMRPSREVQVLAQSFPTPAKPQACAALEHEPSENARLLHRSENLHLENLLLHRSAAVCQLLLAAYDFIGHCHEVASTSHDTDPTRRLFLRGRPRQCSFPARIGTRVLTSIRGRTAACQKNTKDRTTTFLRHGASSGAVGSTQAVWNDQRETEPSVTES